MNPDPTSADPVLWSQADEYDLAEQEAIIENGVQSAFESLLVIRDRRLYRKHHRTFESYCQERWGISRSRAYQLIDAAKVAQNLSTNVDKVTITEGLARPLVSLPAPQQREAWAKAVESAPNGKPTARQVEAAVAQVAPGPPAPPAKPHSPPTKGQAPASPQQTRFLEEQEPPRKTLQQDPAWLGFLKELNLFLVSLPRRGGIVNLSRDWTKKEVTATIATLEELRDTAARCVVEMKEKRR